MPVPYMVSTFSVSRVKWRQQPLKHRDAMKTKPPIALFIFALALLLMGVAFIARRVVPSETTSQAQTLSDWAHGSNGTLKVMVNYPIELLSNQKNEITLTYEADAILQQNLGFGYVFDAEFNAGSSVITPQKRAIVPLEGGRHSISWEIVPFGDTEINATIQLALGGSDLSGAYAISPQSSFEIPFQVMLSNGLSPNTSFIVGLVMVVVGLLCLLAFYFLYKRNLGVRG